MRPVLFVLLCLAATAAVADSHGPVRNLVSLSVRASRYFDSTDFRRSNPRRARSSSKCRYSPWLSRIAMQP